MGGKISDLLIGFGVFVVIIGFMVGIANTGAKVQLKLDKEQLQKFCQTHSHKTEAECSMITLYVFDRQEYVKQKNEAEGLYDN